MLSLLIFKLIVVECSYVKAQQLDSLCYDNPYGKFNYPLGMFYDSLTGTKYLHGAGLGSASPIETGMRKSTGLNCFENDTVFDTIYCQINSMVRYNGNLWVGGYNSVISPSGINYHANLIEFTPAGPNIFTCTQGLFNDGVIVGMKVLNGDLYVYGDFDSIAGIRADKIAKYDGTTWSTFPLINDVNVIIGSVEWFQGELYIGGRFTDPGQGLLNIGRFNGTNWHSVGTGFPNGASQVGAMMIYNNKLVVGGGMHTSNGDIGNCIQAWDGTSWTTFGSGFDAPWLYGVGELDTLNGELWAAGWFESNVYNLHNLAKWNGSSWDGMNIAIDPNLLVNDIQVTPEGVYITGPFFWVNGDSSLGKVFRIDNSVGLPHAIAQDFDVSPNPTSGKIEVSNLNASCEIKLYNSTGQLIRSEQFQTITNHAQLDISNFNPGVYILEMKGSNNIIRKKVLKI